MESGLVDELGGFEKAVTIAAKLAGIKGEPHIIRDVSLPIEKIFEFLGRNSGSRFNQYLNTFPAPVKYIYSGSMRLENNLIPLQH